MNYTLSTTWTWVLLFALIWELTWKGFALWRAAGLHQSGWFVALLIINSAGILPIIYLILTRNKKTEEVYAE